MSYKIRKVRNSDLYQVKNTETGELFKYPTRADAQEQYDRLVKELEDLKDELIDVPSDDLSISDDDESDKVTVKKITTKKELSAKKKKKK